MFKRFFNKLRRKTPYVSVPLGTITIEYDVDGVKGTATFNDSTCSKEVWDALRAGSLNGYSFFKEK